MGFFFFYQETFNIHLYLKKKYMYFENLQQIQNTKIQKFIITSLIELSLKIMFMV